MITVKKTTIRKAIIPLKGDSIESPFFVELSLANLRDINGHRLGDLIKK